ncbi:MAG: undecaprenyl-diphosphate phosphatase [Kiritimatiellae bacterium]|nr:undecaprenyl-diphosphate phosphatase [Kiritimatiellia bacterium]
MENFLNMVWLAVLQGVTEFLPVSSSGHLVLLQKLLRVESPGETVEVVLHVGTMLSILAYYRKTIGRLIAGVFKGDGDAWRTVLCIALSAVPAVFFYFLCKDRIDAFYENAAAVGGFLLFTGFVLTALRWIPGGTGKVTPARAVLIGIAQAIAILPGVSRSGMTISSARMSGVSPDEAAEFSFLMCLPLLAGAAVLSLLGHTSGAEGASVTEVFPTWVLASGCLFSAVIGYASLALLVRLLRSGRFWVFGLYCAAVGIAVLCLM